MLSTPSMQSLRLGVVGCGSIGKRHIKNLQTLGVERIVAFDPRPDRRREVEELGVATFATLEEIWDARPDAVLVTSPNRLHVATAIEAAERGISAFIEKPVSDRHDDALERLLTIVCERRVVTLVGCNLRFHPGLVRAKEIVESGRLGRIVSCRAEFGQYLPDWHPWEDYRQCYSARRELGGGIVLDAIHELDYVRWLMGEVATVAAFAGHLSHIEIDTEDTASVLLRFASGAFGEVHLDYVQRSYTRCCQIVGDEGTLSWDFGRGGELRVFEAATKKWETMPGPPGWNPNDMYVAEMRHFLAALRRAEEPVQDVAAATAALDLAMAIKESAETAKFVRLPRNQGDQEKSS